MSDELKKTVRILQKPRASLADRNVWSRPVESGEFELVSTMMLQTILKSDDGTARQQIEAAASLDVEGQGLLAHNAKDDRYEIVDVAGNDDFSLVSTQMLKHILKDGDAGASVEGFDDLDLREMDSGFDPYNHD
jgi:hypothetical protein